MDQKTGKVKRFGAKPLLGSGAADGPKDMEPADNNGGMNKWLSGITAQLAGQEEEDGFDVRNAPINLFKIDPTNPRELEIEPEEIIENIEVLRLPQKAYSDDDSWISDYEAAVRELFGDNQKTKDCLEVAFFAASLKSPKNVMAPICSWREETTLYIIAGERRYLAHLFMDAQSAVTRIWPEKPDPLEMKILQWQENYLRADLKLSGKITNMRQIIAAWQKKKPDEKITVRKFSSLVAMQKSQASLWLKVAKSKDENLNRAIKAGKLNAIEVAFEISGMDEEGVKAYVSRIDAGENITKELIAAEKSENKLDAEGSSEKEVKQKKSVPALRLNKQKNHQPVAFIVRTVAEKLNVETLNAEIAKLDMDCPNDLQEALSKIFEYLESKGVA